jgi:hypothetical protein
VVGRPVKRRNCVFHLNARPRALRSACQSASTSEFPARNIGTHARGGPSGLADTNQETGNGLKTACMTTNEKCRIHDPF